MSITLEKTAISDLQPGMYVARLDRPWLETPYKVQGILIRDDKDIERLTQYCNFVYVDTEKSLGDFAQGTAPKAALTDEEQKYQLIGAKPRQYEKKSQFNEELKIAFTEHAVLGNAIKGAMERVAQDNHLDLPSLNKAILPMVESVIRNPDAFSWLTMMKKRDDYAYNHSISSSIWAAAFGRNLGLPIKAIQSVATGALLFDIGKAKLPEKLVQNPNIYNSIEFNLVKKHVDYGVEIVKSIDGISEEIVNMVSTHHERNDGSGYPHGLKQDEIPLFGKMAGIIDCYDAIISNRPHAKAISPHDAVKKLYSWSGKDFQTELIEQFIQVVGVYPVGTLVVLSDGRVGVVTAHNKVRRLRPKVMLILDKEKQQYNRFKGIDLLKDTEGEDGQPLNIVKAVNPSFYGIDPGQYYF